MKVESIEQGNRKALKILVLTHYYPPEMGAAAARVHGLSRWLVNFGHKVTVITGFPNYPLGIVSKVYSGKLRSCEILDGVEVIRSWIYASFLRSNIHRLSNYFSFVISSIISGFRLDRSYDIVLVSSPPLFIGLAGLVIARIHRIPFVFDIRDIWPELAVEAGEFDPLSAIVRWGERLERFLYHKANYITVVTHAKREKLISKGVSSHKLSVVPNGVDFDLLNPDRKNGIPELLNLKEKFLVTYAGLIGIFQGIEIVIDAASILCDYKDIHFLIIGDGIKRFELEQRVEQKQLSNITFIPLLPREEIPTILFSSDVALIPLVSNQMDDTVPSKLLEAWGCHTPVILAAGGEAKRLVEESGGGLVVSPGDSQQLAQSILKLVTDRGKIEKLAERGYNYVKKHFDRSDITRRMENLFQIIVE